MANIPEMRAPLCLVENREDGLEVNQDTVNVISRIACPLVVVAIVGPYRTGKSYLMNRLMGRNNGFALGSTIQSKTKGIWVWCRPHPRDSNKCLLLLDTEGLGDVEKGSSTNDNWIFALATLLSSTLVYNNLATLQNDAIDKLHFVTELTELIRVRSATKEEDGSEFNMVFPGFVWTVRDFTLELEHEGQSINADEYLNKALELRHGHSKKIQEYNLPRECIRNFFKPLKCFVFERPVQDTKLFKSMETLRDDQLDPSFLRQSHNFVSYIFEKSSIKSFLGKSLNGSSLCSVLETYVDTIKSGQIPCLENAFTAMAQIENQKAVEEALKVYRGSRDFVSLPTETVQELSEIHSNFEKKAVEAFFQKSFDDKDNQYQALLKGKINSEYTTLLKENDEASKTKCAEALKKVGADLERKLSSGEYLRPGGFQEYEKDKSKVLQDYLLEPGKGIKAQEVLQTYLKDKEAEGKNILKGDQTMSENEKKIAAEKEAAEIAEQKRRAAEEEKKKTEQLMADQEKSNKEHMEQLEKKMKEEREQLQKEHDLALTQKLEEHKKLMEAGFEQKANAAREEITQLKNKIAESEKDGGFWGFVKKASEVLLPLALPFVAARVGLGTLGSAALGSVAGSATGSTASPKPTK